MNRGKSKYSLGLRILLTIMAAIVSIILIGLIGIGPVYAQQQTVIKDSQGKVLYVKVQTSNGYIVKDKDGKLIYTIIENDRERRIYDAQGRLISTERKGESNDKK